MGHENVLAMSRMNSAVVLFLDTVERVIKLAEMGNITRGSLTSVLPLSTPSQKTDAIKHPPFHQR